MALDTPPSSLTSSPDKSRHEQAKSEMDRNMFIPGEITLARSNEDTEPLDMEVMRHMLGQPYDDIWKEIRGMPPTDLTKKMVADIYPGVEQLIDKYWLLHEVDIKEIDLIRISRDFNTTDPADTWLQLSAPNNKNDLLKQMAKEVGILLHECGYTDMHCIILEDDYERKTTNDANARFEDGTRSAQQAIEF